MSRLAALFLLGAAAVSAIEPTGPQVPSPNPVLPNLSPNRPIRPIVPPNP